MNAYFDGLSRGGLNGATTHDNPCSGLDAIQWDNGCVDGSLERWG